MFNQIDFGTITEKNFTFNIVNASCYIAMVIPSKINKRAETSAVKKKINFCPSCERQQHFFEGGGEFLNFPFFQALVSDRLTHGLLSMFSVCTTLIKEYEKL